MGKEPPGSGWARVVRRGERRGSAGAGEEKAILGDAMQGSANRKARRFLILGKATGKSRGSLAGLAHLGVWVTDGKQVPGTTAL